MSKKSIAERDLLNRYFSVEPRSVEGLNNTSVLYYTQQLIKKLFGVFEIQGAPDGWDINYMKERIFLDGKLCVTDTAMGVLPLQTGVAGINVFNHPTTCVIANPVLGSFERLIDTDCALVLLQYDYGNAWPMINRYAALLASCDGSISVNLINSRVAAIFGAENKKEAESFKLMFDQITEGKPGVFVGEAMAKKLSERLMYNRVKESYVADQIENLKHQIMDDFLSDLGVENANTDKRERLITNEVESNYQEIRAGAEHWLDNINEGFAKANSLYSLNLRMIRREWQREEVNNDVHVSEPD